MNKLAQLIISLTIVLSALSAQAWYPRAPEERLLDTTDAPSVIGSNRYYQVAEGETLVQLARAFGLGYMNLTQANPGVDPWLPPVGQRVILPYATVLPRTLQEGITINLADYKLYLKERVGNQHSVRIYPVGIGVEGWETPLGSFQVLSKAPRPTWNVPASIRAQDPSLPRSVPPGPDNPLGDFWMAFTPQKHGIHGTNEPYGVGRRVSHGCIRLYPEDIKDLYRRTPVGTPVNVIYEPVKIGMQDDKIYLELHPDYLRSQPALEDVIEQRCVELGCNGALDDQQIRFAAEKRLGYPLEITSARSKMAYRHAPHTPKTQKRRPR